ncbi:MAG: 23S rRNA (uracil(1939)-C(5))-methyltransferase RlmD [Bacillota bacterium]
MSKKNIKNPTKSADFPATAAFCGEITGYTHQGLGVTRHQGRVVFVPYALKGEQAEITPTGKKKGILYGKITKLTQSSANRTEPLCKLYTECGGCSLQHADYAEQLKIKEEIVRNSLERLGNLTNIAEKIKPVIGMTQPCHYRSKGVFRLSFSDGVYHLGFLAENSHTVAKSRCTLLFPSGINQILDNLEYYLNNGFQYLAEALSSVMIRTSFGKNQSMLILFVKKSAYKPQISLSLKKIYDKLSPELPGLTVFGYSLDSGEPNPLYNNLTLLSPESVITEKLNGISYQISPASFFQVNPEQAAKMLTYIKKQLKDRKNLQIIDAYSGIGTIGLALAETAFGVDCIEVIPEAVKNAAKNCRINNLPNVRCHCGKAEELFHKVSRNHPDDTEKLVIVDPPRKGCHTSLLRGILDFAPQSLIYVSCNPSTLARDLAILQESYEISSVQPFDMFPQSYHVETVVLMSRVDGK